jgi:hypothetical protein
VAAGPLQILQTVSVTVIVFRDVVVMIMRMDHCMGMGGAVMGMGKSMGMHVHVVPYHGIHDHKDRSCDHDDQGRHIGQCQGFPQKKEGQESPYKGI